MGLRPLFSLSAKAPTQWCACIPLLPLVDDSATVIPRRARSFDVAGRGGRVHANGGADTTDVPQQLFRELRVSVGGVRGRALSRCSCHVMWLSPRSAFVDPDECLSAVNTAHSQPC